MAHVKDTALKGCLKDIVEGTNGELCEWNPPNIRTVRGLPNYVWKSGLWRFIAAAGDVNPELKFKETDYEGVVAARIPHRSPEVIVCEAKKLMWMTSGWRRVLRMKYEVPTEPKKALSQAKASVRITKGFFCLNMEVDDESLESLEESEYCTTRCRAQGPMSVSSEESESEESRVITPSPKPKVTAKSPVKQKVTATKQHEPEKEKTSYRQHEPREENTSYYINEQSWAIRSSDQEPAIKTEKSVGGKTRFIWNDGDEWVCNELEYESGIWSSYDINEENWAIRSSDQRPAINQERGAGGNTRFIWNDGDEWVCKELEYESNQSIVPRPKPKTTTEYFLNPHKWAIRSFDQVAAESKEKSGNNKTMFIWDDGDRWMCNELVFEDLM